jgi:hypothetical protein
MPNLGNTIFMLSHFKISRFCEEKVFLGERKIKFWILRLINQYYYEDYELLPDRQSLILF